MRFLNLYIIICISVGHGANIERSIDGSRVADICDFPHQVFLQINQIYNCGGVILDHLHILTIASCLFTSDSIPLNSADVKVLVGHGYEQRYEVYKIQIHQNFTISSYRNDKVVNNIALLTLAKRIVFGVSVKSADLSTAEYIPDNAIVKVTSFDRIFTSRHIPFRLIEFQQKIIHNGTTQQFCVSETASNYICKSFCGNGVIFNKTVVGLAVHSGACDGKFPDIYLRIYIHQKWIENALGRQNNSQSKD